MVPILQLWPALVTGASGSAAAGSVTVVVGRYLGTVVVTVHGVLEIAGSETLGQILADVIDGQGNLVGGR